MREIFSRPLVAAMIAVVALFLPSCGDNPDPAALPEDTSGNFSYPLGVVPVGTDLYVTDSGNSTIRKVVPSVSISTLAGLAGYPGAVDGTGPAARFTQPRYLVASGSDLYVAGGRDRAIRKIVIAGQTVSTLAGLLGTAGTTVSGDADIDGTNARFTEPTGIAMVGTNFYILDWGAGAPFLRRVVIATGVTSELTLAPGILGDKPIADYLARSYGMATDGTFLYVANTNASTILKGVIDNTTTPWTVTFSVVAGASYQPGWADSPSGPATDARFFNPTGIACDGTSLYVADTGNSTIRKIVLPSGPVTTLAGSAGLTGIDNGTGSTARFKYPFGVTFDSGSGNLYVADTHNHTIRQVTLTGTVTTIAGKPGVRGSNDVP